ncbi:hypothetical protein MUP77_03640 [Candidatus Bathyarchaeota archaeon]|nr:hypothetical protein [Candidatus Bathyarchaeota archaeon]
MIIDDSFVAVTPELGKIPVASHKWCTETTAVIGICSLDLKIKNTSCCSRLLMPPISKVEWH